MKATFTCIIALVALLSLGCAEKDDTSNDESTTEYNDCEGKSCGEPCHICDPDLPDCAEPGTNTVCSLASTCVIEAEMAPCEAPDPCEAKECGSSCYPIIDPVADMDPVPHICDAEGTCIISTEDAVAACEGELFNDCADKECGDDCTTCDPEVPGCTETEEAKACNAFSECVSFIFVTEEDCNPGNPCEGMACGEPCFEIGGGTGSGAGMPAPSYCDANETCVNWDGDIADLCPAPPFDGCADKACGDLCYLCDPEDEDCVLPGASTYCSAEGVCSFEDEMGECETEDACVAMDAEEGPDTCDGGGSGYKWDGAACVYQGDLCNCIGEDCDNLFEDYESCWEAFSDCAGAWDACGDKACGAPCEPCDPADPDCPLGDINTLCNSIGECVEWYEDTADLCEGEPCPESEKTYLDGMPMPLPPCTAQDVGKSCTPCSYLAQSYYCWENEEEVFTDEEAVLWCDSPSITEELDEPPSDDFICSKDGDCILESEVDPGSEACKDKKCGDSCWPPDTDGIDAILPLVAIPAYCNANGNCVEWFEDPSLLCYDPCADKACGDSCTICDPNNPDCMETAVPKWCGSDNVCTANTPNDCS